MQPFKRTYGELPKFSQPPVSEVAVGIEFVPMPSIGAVHLARLAEMWKDHFPHISEKPALPPPQPPPAGGPTLNSLGLHLERGTPPIRLWMQSEDQGMLMQAQRDRLILNWKRQGDASYPSYETLRGEFLSRWNEFSIQASRDAQVRATVAEVTYVNTIESPAGGADTSGVIRVSAAAPDVHGRLLESRVQQVRDVGSDEFQAHQFITANTDNTGTDAVSLTLVTRVIIADETATEAAVAGYLDHAHEAGVRVFTDITTPEMHKRWGREQ